MIYIGIRDPTDVQKCYGVKLVIEEMDEKIVVLTLKLVPLRCKASQGTNMGQRVGSPTTVTLMGVPLHFRVGQSMGLSLKVWSSRPRNISK